MLAGRELGRDASRILIHDLLQAAHQLLGTHVAWIDVGIRRVVLVLLEGFERLQDLGGERLDLLVTDRDPIALLGDELQGGLARQTAFGERARRELVA